LIAAPRLEAKCGRRVTLANNTSDPRAGGSHPRGWVRRGGAAAGSGAIR